MKIAHKPCAPFLEEFLGGEHTYRYRLYGTAAVPWGQTCSLFPLDLMSEAVAVLIEMILTSLEFSTCNHSSKFLRSWGKSSWLPPPSWRRSACRNAQHDQASEVETRILGTPTKAEGTDEDAHKVVREAWRG